MAAALQAELLAGYAQPLEVGRPRQHLLEQLRVADVRRGTLLERVTGLRDTVGEFVSDPLEIAEAEGPGSGGVPFDAGVDRNPGKAVGEKTGELVLEAGDLTAKLGSRQALVAVDSDAE